MKVARFVAAARDEFLAAVLHYSNQEPELGERFAAEVEETVARILTWPRSGSPAAANTRRAVLSHFPFSIVYKPVNGDIVIFAVAHQSRLPGYWVSRVQDR